MGIEQTVMKIKHIFIMKETREGEGRVALTPTAVASLVAKNYEVCVETYAGMLAGFSDEAYIKTGARIFELGKEKFPPCSLILRVKRPIKAREQLENKLFSKDTIMIGFLDPFDVDYENHIENWQALGIIPISLELLNLPANDPKNAQAAMSRFAGRLALQDALQRYNEILPKKVTIFGTGPAGLGAAFYARDLQLPVQLFGRQERYRKMVENAGIIYYVLPKGNPNTFIHAHLAEQTIVIAAARSIGQKSPLLIDDEALLTLPENAIVVDLSAGEGGCVLGSKEDQVVTVHHNISIVNVSGYPKSEPQAASKAYSACILNLLNELIRKDEINLKQPMLS